MEAELFFSNHRMLSFQSAETNTSNRIDQSVQDAPLLIPPERISGILHLEPVPELKHDTGLAMFWSIEEQLLLAEGLSKYSNVPKISKYIKIAAMLKNKTVRDVAFRCRWITNENRRRRKQDYKSRMMKDYKLTDSKFKVKQMDCSREGNSGPPVNRMSNVPSRSFTTHHPDCSANGTSCEGSCISCPMRHLLDENAQVLWQIRDNLDALKVQENIHLLLSAKNNLTSILDRISKVPGLSQMNPIPTSLDENLFSKFLFLSPQVNSRQELRF